MQPTGPVDGDVGLVAGQFAGSVEGGSSIERAVAVEAVKDGAIVAHVIRIASVAQIRSETVSRRYSGFG